MLSSKPPPASSGRPTPVDSQRSNSRASTNSYDTATALDDSSHNPRQDSEPRYAPIRPSSHHAPVLFTHSPTHDGLAPINQYNNSYPPAIDPQLAPHPRQDLYGPPQPPPQGNGERAAAEVLMRAANDSSARNQLQGTKHPRNANGPDPEKKEKKSTSSTAANEKELRELIDNNWHRSLESISKDVRGAEKTQKSEKAKQLFAMRWLREYCKTGDESVPRNRVYTFYTQRCGTERVDTLNPASFGKLVRIIFPGIATRRLGVRGESKYHYVNLMLADDKRAAGGVRPPSSRKSIDFEDRDTPMEQPQEFRPLTRPPTDTAAIPQPDGAFDSIYREPATGPATNPASRCCVFADPHGAPFQSNDDLPQLYNHTLKFSSPEGPSTQKEALVLPNIHACAPPKADTDAAEALSALYRTHCTSLVEAVRYVKEKQFMRLLGSLNGTMTVPVSRLFDHPNLSPWIQHSDILMYQQMIKFLSQLALQVIPAQVFTMLQTLSNELPDLIRKHFRTHPEHVLQAKLQPAVIFARHLQRLLRVNETAHAAANLLMNDNLRNMMWTDWTANVQAKRVVETALADCGHQEAYFVLVEIKQLLEPLEPANIFDNPGNFSLSSPTDQIQGDWMQNLPHHQQEQKGQQRATSADNIIERWAAFLKSLPARFPQTKTRMLIYYVEAVGNACLRDITVSQASSFGAWWIVKVWIDEMMLWLAEMGGFLDDQQTSSLPSLAAYEGFEGLMQQNISRPGSLSGFQHPEPMTIEVEGRHQNTSFSASTNGTGYATNGNVLVESRRSSGPYPMEGPPSAGTFRYSSKPVTANVTAMDRNVADKLVPHAHDMHFGIDAVDTNEDSGIGMEMLGDMPENITVSGSTGTDNKTGIDEHGGIDMAM